MFAYRCLRCFQRFHNHGYGIRPIFSHHKTVWILLKMFQQKNDTVHYNFSLDLRSGVVYACSFCIGSTDWSDSSTNWEHDQHYCWILQGTVELFIQLLSSACLWCPVFHSYVRATRYKIYLINIYLANIKWEILNFIRYICVQLKHAVSCWTRNN